MSKHAFGWSSAWAVLSTLLLGCGQPVPVNVLAIDRNDGPGGAPSAEDLELFEEAQAILGVEFEWSTREYGTIVVSLVSEPAPTGLGGTGVGPRFCRPSVVSLRDARTIAHEVGHILGLPHICDDGDDTDPPACTDEHVGNLMHGLRGPREWVDLNDDQQEEIEKGRRRITACR